MDHLPASDKVPTTLKFKGIERIVGTPGYLTYAADIHRYMKAIADAAPTRAKYWNIGKTEEGRDIVILAIANEETIKNLDTYKGYLAELTDPRKTSEARAKILQKTAKPIYYLTSGMHSTETGGPEMLMELAYRLVVDETPFVKSIRDNVITMITPVIEVDGREKVAEGARVGGRAGRVWVDIGSISHGRVWNVVVWHRDDRRAVVSHSRRLHGFWIAVRTRDVRGWRVLR